MPSMNECCLRAASAGLQRCVMFRHSDRAYQPDAPPRPANGQNSGPAVALSESAPKFLRFVQAWRLLLRQVVE